MEDGELLHRNRHEEPVSPEQQEVYDFIDDFWKALSLAKACKENPTPDNLESLRQKVIDLRHRSGWGVLKYPIRIRVAEGIHAETSLGEYRPEEPVSEDVVNHLGDITTEKVEFYSDLTIGWGGRPHWLTVFGLDFEAIEPVFEEA